MAESTAVASTGAANFFNAGKGLRAVDCRATSARADVIPSDILLVQDILRPTLR